MLKIISFLLISCSMQVFSAAQDEEINPWFKTILISGKEVCFYDLLCITTKDTSFGHKAVAFITESEKSGYDKTKILDFLMEGATSKVELVDSSYNFCVTLNTTKFFLETKKVITLGDLIPVIDAMKKNPRYYSRDKEEYIKYLRDRVKELVELKK